MSEDNEPLYPCPCCGYLTRDAPEYGSFDICPVCFWEDDDVQARKPDNAGGANHVSLNEARENFKKFGAKEPGKVKYTRAPLPEEFPGKS